MRCRIGSSANRSGRRTSAHHDAYVDARLGASRSARHRCSYSAGSAPARTRPGAELRQNAVSTLSLGTVLLTSSPPLCVQRGIGSGAYLTGSGSSARRDAYAVSRHGASRRARRRGSCGAGTVPAQAGPGGGARAALLGAVELAPRPRSEAHADPRHGAPWFARRCCSRRAGSAPARA